MREREGLRRARRLRRCWRARICVEEEIKVPRDERRRWQGGVQRKKIVKVGAKEKKVVSEGPWMRAQRKVGWTVGAGWVGMETLPTNSNYIWSFMKLHAPVMYMTVIKKILIDES